MYVSLYPLYYIYINQSGQYSGIKAGRAQHLSEPKGAGVEIPDEPERAWIWQTRDNFLLLTQPHVMKMSLQNKL